MVRRIVPDHGIAVLLSTIERTAFARRETPWRINDYIALAQTGRSAIFADDAVAEGFVILTLAADEGEIINLGVIPSARRKGLARELVAAAIAHARAEGATRMFLEVAEDNRAARALYAGAGFVQAGRRSGYYARPDGSRVDALLLARDLAD